MPSPRPSGRVVGVALLLAGCTARIDGSALPAQGGGPTDPFQSGGLAGLGSSGINSTSGCTGIDPGPGYIRRLTRLEYDHTLRDLLGEIDQPSSGFPAEEKGLGFDNNAASLSVSPVLTEQYLAAAEKVAAQVTSRRLASVVACDPKAIGVDACGQEFIASFAKRAYRRPLEPDDTALLTAVFDAGKATDFVTGVRLVIEAVLQSPRFLYRVELDVAPTAGNPTVSVPAPVGMQTVPVVQVTSWEMASRLAYQLWGTMPDDTLLAAAEANQLTTREQIKQQTERMLDDPKAHDMVTHFHDQWLRIGDLDQVSKDVAIFPEFSPTIAGLMQAESRQFLDYVVWQGDGTLKAALTAPFTFVNGPLAQYYGISGVSGDAFAKVTLDPRQRGGLLTQGGLLSLLAKPNQTSPVHRGKFVREQLLCSEMPPPPPGLEIKAPDLSPSLTTRQRFAQHAASPTCSPCHHLMDPIGLGLEGFDGAGKQRPTENGVAVDSTGEVLESDAAGAFNGAVELEAKLAGSAQVQDCMTRKWFRYAYGRGETAIDACSMSSLQTKLAAGRYKIRDLLVALTETDAFLYRRAVPAAGGAK